MALLKKKNIYCETSILTANEKFNVLFVNKTEDHTDCEVKLGSLILPKNKMAKYH